MVQIIESADGGTADGALELSVYQGSDGRTIMAHAAHPAQINGNQATWPIIIGFGTPARQAYELAIALAEQHGIAKVRINDPKGLFPPSVRPSCL